MRYSISIQKQIRFIIVLAFSLSSFLVKAQAPVANFTSDIVQGCDFITVKFQDLSTNNPTSWEWDFGDGSAKVTLQNPTKAFFVTSNVSRVFTIKLTAKNASGSSVSTKTSYIKVFANPVTNFTFSPSSGCVPVTAQFSSTSTSDVAITNYAWNFGDGNTGNTASPSHQYLQANSNYRVGLTITNANGCVRSLEKAGPVVNALPVPTFGADKTGACEPPLVVNFLNTTPGNIVSHSWDLGDGSNSTAKSPTKTYNTAGNKTVSLTVVDNNGCTGNETKTDYIKINPFSGSFTLPKVEVCVGESFTISDVQALGAVTYSWQFGNGAISNVQNPSYSYPSDGNYTITLRATNTVGCFFEMTQDIVVNPLPVLDFSADDQTGCVVPFSVNFSSPTPNVAEWNWNFGDGTTSNVSAPNKIYSNIGTYAVSLSVKDNKGCAKQISKASYIRIQLPTVNFSSNRISGCGPLSVDFVGSAISPNPITNWEWSFGDALNTTSTVKNPNMVYADTGRYTVTLKVTDAEGCQNQITKIDNIFVGQKTTTDFAANPTTECYGIQKITKITFNAFNNDSFISLYAWDFGDGGKQSTINDSTEYTYIDTGKFDVFLIPIHNGCYGDTVTKTKYITILPSLAAFMAPSPICDSSGVKQFIDMSKGVDIYEWNFGRTDTVATSVTITKSDSVALWNDGSSQKLTNIQQVSYFYNKPGTYQIQLITTNLNGCKDTAVHQLIVTEVVSRFSSNVGEICKGEVLELRDSATTSVGRVTSLQWFFGDGAQLIEVKNITPPQPPQPPALHTYASSGTYDLQLIARDNNGCVDTLTKLQNITVAKSPQLDIIPTVHTGCVPQLVTYQNAVILGDHPIAKMTADYTDGNTLDISWGGSDYVWTENGVVTQNTATLPASLIHTYINAINTRAKFKIVDQLNCDDTLSLPINVTDPRALFTLSKDTWCNNMPVSVINTSTGSNLTYSWDFGDGSAPKNIISPQHTYVVPKDSVFDITLTVTDVNNCVSDSTKAINISRPIAKFVADNRLGDCPPFPVNFTDTTAGPIVSRSWTFGTNSAPSVLKYPNHVYPDPGEFDVQLTVLNSFGCTDTKLETKYITVSGPSGSFNFNPKVGCAPHEVDFTSVTKDAVKFQWVFDDGNNDTTMFETSHTYTQGQTYFPVLIVTDLEGCSYSIRPPASIEVIEVKPDFVASDTLFCDNLPVDFQDMSTSFHTITEWEWEFGDDSSSTIQNPTHTYNYGIYDVKLTVTASGCSYSLVKPDYIKVYQTPNAVFSINDTVRTVFQSNAFQTLQIKNLTAPIINPVTWSWEYGDNTTDTIKQKNKTYFESGTFDLLLMAKSHESCVDTMLVTVIIDENIRIPNVFTPNSDGVNDRYLEGLDVELKIVNRWGQQLYEGNLGWDGTYNGKEVSPGTYFYIITTPKGKVYKGPVTVIRK